MNARQELVGEVKDANSLIKCALLETDEYSEVGKKEYLLRCGYSNEDLRKFFSEIDFEYDNGYGGQELYGNVWFNDGTWLERGEYDGAEWWEHKKLPEIPDSLTSK